LRTQQERQSRMPPPTNYPVAKGGIITNTPLVPSLSTPSTGMRTRELHGPGYYHVGYAEQMNAMYGRDGTHQGMIHHPVDHPPEDPVVKLLMTLNGKADLVRMFSSRRIDPRVLKFGTSKVPRLTRTTLVNTEVHQLIQYIHQLLSHEAFDDSVLGNMIYNETITLLGYVFRPTETASRHPIINHWTTTSHSGLGCGVTLPR